MAVMSSLTCRTLGRAALTLLLLLSVVGCGDKPEKLVTSAQQYMDRQDYKGAIIQLKNALKANPNYAEARYLLGASLLQVNDFASAEKELRRASELGYSQDKVAPGLAKAVLQQGRAQQVVSEFTDVHLTDPSAESKLRTVVGDALLALGKVEDSADSYNKALSAQPGYAVARVGQARVAAAKKDLAGAQKIVDETLATSPAQFDALVLTAELARATNRVDDSISAYRKAIEAQPDGPSGLGARFALVLTLLEQGRLAEANAETDGMAKLAPHDLRTLHLKSLLALQEGKYSQALDFGLQVLKAAPESVPALRVTGVSEFFLGNDQQAQHMLEKVLRQTPKDLYVRRVLIGSVVRASDLVRAKRLLEEGRAIAPKDPGLLLLSGEVALAEKDLDRAAKAYEQAIAEGLHSPALSARLGQLYLAAGQTAEGINILESSSAASDEQIQSESLLATHYLRQGKIKEALPWIDRIEQKRPADPVGPLLRGATYLASKDESGARASFERALQLQPAYTPALLALARLDLQAKNAPVAEKRFQAVLEKDPNDEAATIAYAAFLEAEKAPVQQRKEILARLIQHQPGSVRARVALVSALVEAGEVQNALTVGQEGLAADPDNPGLLRVTAAAQLASGSNSQAVATLSRLADVQPQSPIPQVLLAYAHVKAGDDQRALDALGRALKIRPDFLTAQLAIAQVNFRLGNMDAVAVTAHDIQRQRPKAPEGYLIEANALRGSKRWAEADRVLKKGLDHAPWSTLAISRHLVLLDSGQAQRAKEFASEWLTAYPKDAAFRSYIAQRALAEGDYSEASRQYRAVLGITPDDPAILNNLAWVGGKTHDPKALDYAERAYVLAPDSAQIMDTLGWLLVEKGDVARGMAVLRKAVELAPQTDAIRLTMAKALVSSGDKKAARDELERLAKKGNGFSGQAEVQELLKKL